jgi:circadian clock protein KaiC
MHLVVMHRMIEDFKPDIVIVDPISNLVAAASKAEVKSMLSRMIDYLKTKQITAFCTDLTSTTGPLALNSTDISSLMDTWLLLQVLETSGERNRGLYLLKSRGMSHSNQVREFILSDSGAQLRDVYIGSGLVLTGSSRVAQEAHDKALALECQQEIERKQREIERKKTLIEAQIIALRTQFELEKEDLDRLIARELLRVETFAIDNLAMSNVRQADERVEDLTDKGVPL